ncbi:hypothetical protein [Paeniglutamicibacter sp. Y32M11]|uniref:hypothetical protein n=1 Tax=Paeniglutamicibacter sp. Y32M11 TaxID=2853258 RepID=UPI001C532673|nr:hypothetical protein [Paeniglutamicibacter sp. Y32M11]QXQ08963.1 hypothetical protein KUF55_10540 [Paeniglutamicibacter sp. Y32M11]
MSVSLPGELTLTRLIVRGTRSLDARFQLLKLELARQCIDVSDAIWRRSLKRQSLAEKPARAADGALL